MSNRWPRPISGRTAAQRTLELLVSIALIAACGGNPGAANSPTLTPSASVAPPGALAIYFAIPAGSNISSIPAPNGHLETLKSTTSAIVQVVPGYTPITLFDQFTSQSFAPGAIFPITSLGRLFTVVAFEDQSGSKSLRQLDPRTGASASSNCDFATTQMFGDFALLGSRIYYHASGNFFTPGIDRGDLVYSDLSNCASKHVVRKRGNTYTGDDVLVAGGKLYTTTRQGDNLFVFNLDPDTGGLLATVGLSATAIIGPVFAGDDALYFVGRGAGAGVVQIVRFNFRGLDYATVVATVNDPNSITTTRIDEAEGDVYFAYRDPAPHFYVVRQADRQPHSLDLDPSLYPSSVIAGGRILHLA